MSERIEPLREDEIRPPDANFPCKSRCGNWVKYDDDYCKDCWKKKVEKDADDGLGVGWGT